VHTYPTQKIKVKYPPKKRKRRKAIRTHPRGDL
jgi:hypothetical protein